MALFNYGGKLINEIPPVDSSIIGSVEVVQGGEVIRKGLPPDRINWIPKEEVERIVNGVAGQLHAGEPLEIDNKGRAGEVVEPITLEELSRRIAAAAPMREVADPEI